jgi:hypothetical protein
MSDQQPDPAGPAPSSHQDGPLVAEQYVTTVTADLPATPSVTGLEGLIAATMQVVATEQLRDVHVHMAAVQARLAARQQLSHLASQVIQERTQHPAQDAYAALVEEAQQALTQQLTTMNELSDSDSVRLQEAMDRHSRMMTTLSNILKKLNDTAAAISQNLK